MEYFVDLFGDPRAGTGRLHRRRRDRSSRRRARPRSMANRSSSTSRSTPSAATTGYINTAMVLGDFVRRSDWAPDEGHGTIEPFSDVPGSSRPRNPATSRPAARQVIDGHPGRRRPRARRVPGAGRASSPTTRDAQQVPVTVDLTVTMPEEFGVDHRDRHRCPQRRAAGRRDRHRSHAEWPAGTPLELTATTADDGTLQHRRTGRHVAGRLQPRGLRPGRHGTSRSCGASPPAASTPPSTASSRTPSSRASVPVFILTPDRTGSATVELGNPGGHADLESRSVRSISAARRPAPPSPLRPPRSRCRPARTRNARTTRGFGAAAKGLAVPPRDQGRGRRPRLLAGRHDAPVGRRLRRRRLALRPGGPHRRPLQHRGDRGTSSMLGPARRVGRATWRSIPPAT